MRTEAPISSDPKFSRRKLLTFAASSAFLAACQKGTETAPPLQQKTLTAEPRGTLDPNIHTVTSTPDNPLFTGTPFPFPTGTNPESDKDGTLTPIETPTSSENSTEWITYDSSSERNVFGNLSFQIDYPTDFHHPPSSSGKTDIGKGRSALFIKSSPDIMNTVVEVESFDDAVDLNNFRDFFINGTDIKANPGSDIEGVPTLTMEADYVQTISSSDGTTTDINAKESAIIFVKNGIGWLIDYSTSTELFDEYNPTFQKMIDSFRITS